MSGGGKKQTVGYKYHLGMHMALFHGPADKLIRIRVDERDAWVGETVGGQIYIDKPKLFGGEKREGGVKGYVDIEMGAPAQGQNSYLLARLGALIPAFRGVVCAVLRQVYVGMNPYLKPWDFRFQRIHTRQNGLAQWYDAKAAIVAQYTIAGARNDLVGVSAANWQYRSVPLTDTTDYSGVTTGWSTGAAPFADRPHPYADPPFAQTVGTTVPVHTKIWLRREITLADLILTHITVKHDNALTVWVNGVQLAMTATDSPWVSSASFMPTQSAITIVIKVEDFTDPPPGNYIYADAYIHQETSYDLNPAHIIRECLTDPDWGMGYPEAEMNDTAFTAAADTLHGEGMGMSLLWDRQIPLEDFIKECLKHIDATLYVDRTTGKFVLKLIRDDYVAGALLLLDENNVERIENAKTTAIGELVNSVTVKYWDGSTGKDATVKLDDIALAGLQGAVIGATIDYPGFTNPVIAARVCARDLRALSTPLTSCVVYANRAASGLNVGDVFKLNWPDAKMNNIIMRVNAIAFGDGRNQRVKITCSQDVYSLPAAATEAVPSAWVDPVGAAAESPHRLVFEAPYYEVVQRKGDDETNTEIDAYPERGYLLAAGDSPTGATLNAQLWIDSGAGYAEAAQLDFCPYARLAADISPTAETITIDSGVDLDQVAVATHCQIGNELCKVVSVTETTLTAKRGVLDTVPVAHVTGEGIFFWDVYAQGDDIEYASGETISAKILPVTGQDSLDLAAATAGAVTMASRAARPYAPGQCKVNAVYYPATIDGQADLALSWAHRDRKQQTDGDLLDYTYGNIGPEAGQTTTLRIYGEADTLLRTVTGMTGTGYTYAADDERADSALTDASDPHWASVVALLHGDGANASTVFTDETGKAWAVKAAGAQLSNAQKKYGTAAIHANAGYIGTPYSNDFNFGSGAFTVEAWVYLTAFTAPWSTLASFLRSAPDEGWRVLVSDVGIVAWSAYSTGVITQIGSTAGAVALNAWTHVTVSSNGTDRLRIFLNGALHQEFSLSSYAVVAVTNTPLDMFRTLGTSWQFAGYVDDFRITKGVGRYTAPFTLPDAPLPNGKRINGKLRFELESVRAGLTSFQKHDWPVRRTGYGFNYGYYYGGV